MKGVEVIKTALQTLPKLPGVYKMIGEKGILYIGKAKNLKTRVQNYTKLEEQGIKNQVMIGKVLKVEYEVVRDEAEALILESLLIKQNNPPFNILLKDDKSNPYIVLGKGHKFPSITKTRGKPTGNKQFYGPFGDKKAIEDVINVTCKTFKIRTCPDTKFNSVKRPCLEYQIKRCTAPCVGYISALDYAEDVKLASQFLSGKVGDVLKELKVGMQELADREEFELASKFRDKIFSIEKLLKNEKIDFKKLEDVDAVMIKEIGGQVGIEVFSVRSGFSYGGSLFFPAKTEGETLEAIMEFFLLRHYSDFTPPKMIVTNVFVSKATCEALTKTTGLKLKISSPKKGLYKELLDFIFPNLEEKLIKKTGEKIRIKENLIKLKELLELKITPKRIEIYDNSHTNGAFMLGAMVVAGEEGFIKNEYRKFNTKFESTKKGDDYGMLKETLKRRFLNEKLQNIKPDLIIIDGGKGQFSSALEVFEELKIDVPFICMAKGRDRNAGKEWIFFEEKEFQLPFTDPLLYYLQTLRDEAHRFAITSHRKRREKI